VHLVLVVSVAATLAIAAGGCSPANSDPTASGGASTGGASTGGMSSGGASTGGVSTGGMSSGGAGTGGVSTGGMSSGGASGGGVGGTAGASAGAGNGGTAGAVAISYAKDVQPILMAKCGKCHGGQGQGHHDIASTYADAKQPVESLQFDECWTNYMMDNAMPKTIGECSMLLARAGKMPAFEGCDRPTPPNPSVCATQAEKDILTAWVAGGMAP
jgi:hypothetical protein